MPRTVASASAIRASGRCGASMPSAWPREYTGSMPSAAASAARRTAVCSVSGSYGPSLRAAKERKNMTSVARPAASAAMGAAVRDI